MIDIDDDSRRAHLRKLVPLFFVGGLSLLSAPLFHPNNTCKDWLQKWGQLAALPIWVPIHQVAAFGFAVGAGAVFLLCLVGPRRAAGYFGGAFLASGFGMMSLLTVMHATAVSTMGKAFNDATDPAPRELMRTIANAFVSYDVAAEGVAAVLISAGAVVLVYYLWRIGVTSTIPALVLAGDGAIWGVQCYRLLRFIHYGFPEWVPYVSLALWLCATGVLLLVNPRRA
jgi:hypothetical protein